MASVNSCSLLVYCLTILRRISRERKDSFHKGGVIRVIAFSCPNSGTCLAVMLKVFELGRVTTSYLGFATPLSVKINQMVADENRMFFFSDILKKTINLSRGSCLQRGAKPQGYREEWDYQSDQKRNLQISRCQVKSLINRCFDHSPRTARRQHL